MKKLFIIIVVYILCIFVGCGNSVSPLRVLVDETSLPALYNMSDANFKFLSGYISFNLDNTLDGEILFYDSDNDCVFNGRWSVQNNMIVVDIYNTTNSYIFNFGRSEIYGYFANGDLELSFKNNGTRYWIKY